jgi:hypothetical protein
MQAPRYFLGCTVMGGACQPDAERLDGGLIDHASARAQATSTPSAARAPTTFPPRRPSTSRAAGRSSHRCRSLSGAPPPPPCERACEAVPCVRRSADANAIAQPIKLSGPPTCARTHARSDERRKVCAHVCAQQARQTTRADAYAQKQSDLDSRSNSERRGRSPRRHLLLSMTRSPEFVEETFSATCNKRRDFVFNRIAPRKRMRLQASVRRLRLGKQRSHVEPHEGAVVGCRGSRS